MNLNEVRVRRVSPMVTADSADTCVGEPVKWLSYAWSVVTGLFALAVAWLVVGRFQAPFERAVVALLVLVYVSVEYAGTSRGLIILAQEKTGFVRFLELLRASDPEKHRELQTMAAEEQEKNDRREVKLVIAMMFQALIYVVALWSLLSA